MDENSSRNKLYIPVNIKTRFEFFNGFGFPELIITTIVAIISIIISVIYYQISKDFYKSVLIVLVTVSATGMAVKKNEINQSVIDMIKLFFRFLKNQQKYKYAYKDPFGKD